MKQSVKQLLKIGLKWLALVLVLLALIAGIFQLGGLYAERDHIKQAVRDQVTIRSQRAEITQQKMEIRSLRATVSEKEATIASLRKVKSAEMATQLWALARPAASMVVVVAFALILVLGVVLWKRGKTPNHNHQKAMA